MDGTKVVDIERKHADPIRDGPLASVKAEHEKHPVEKILLQAEEGGVKRKRNIMAATYGTHYPLRMMMDQQILSSFHRLPGLPSEFVGLETLSGRDLNIDFGDIYGRPEDSPELATTDLHSEMEKHLKLW